MVHQFIEHARKVGRDAALDDLPDETEQETREMCAALPLDQLPVGGDLEVALAWDHETDTARVLNGDGHRDYAAARHTEFVGTADYVGIDGGVVVVLDYKTGHRYLGPARESWQLRMLALAAARLAGVDAARVAYFYLHEDGTVVPAWASFDAFDLADAADELRDLAFVLTESDEATFREGDHCDYCPAWMSCPPKVALARAIGNGDAMRDLASVERQIEAMTAVELGEVYIKLERVIDLTERVKDTARRRAAMYDVPLGDGRVLGTVQWPYTVVNAGVAYDVIKERHGAEMADKTLPRSATLAKVRALGATTLEEIERRGGVVTEKKAQVRVHRKKETA